MKRKKNGTQKNPSETNIRRNQKVKPFYTVRELMPILGYKSSMGTRRFLQSIGVTFHLIGRKYIFYISEIQNQAPELFASILEAQNINLFYEERSTIQDEDKTTSAQLKT